MSQLTPAQKVARRTNYFGQIVGGICLLVVSLVLIIGRHIYNKTQNAEYSGVVRQSGGDGVPDAEVKAVSGQSVAFVTHTDSDGVFHTVLPSSSKVIRILVQAPGFATRTTVVDLSTGTSEDIVLNKVSPPEPTPQTPTKGSLQPLGEFVQPKRSVGEHTSAPSKGSSSVMGNGSLTSTSTPANVESRELPSRNRPSPPTQSGLCCYLVGNQSVRIVYSGFPASVSEEALQYYLRSHLRELQSSTQADYLLRLVATTELDVPMPGRCPNAERITVNSDLERLTNDGKPKTDRVSASGMACMENSAEQSARAATNNAISNLVSALTKAPMDQ